MKDDNCIFCKLASGEIPSVTIYEDADFRVILDLSPASYQKNITAIYMIWMMNWQQKRWCWQKR